MKPTLIILAAGMGSRYGGLKQLDGVGPNGETIPLNAARSFTTTLPKNVEPSSSVGS